MCDYTYIPPRAERSHEFQEASQRQSHAVCADTQIVSAVTGYLRPLDCAPFGITLLENVFLHFVSRGKCDKMIDQKQLENVECFKIFG